MQPNESLAEFLVYSLIYSNSLRIDYSLRKPLGITGKLLILVELANPEILLQRTGIM